MKNNIHTKYDTFNLLNSQNFKTALKFEAEYVNAVKGGHLPHYIGEQKRKRLVNSINLLSSAESLDLISNLFISKN